MRSARENGNNNSCKELGQLPGVKSKALGRVHLGDVTNMPTLLTDESPKPKQGTVGADHRSLVRKLSPYEIPEPEKLSYDVKVKKLMPDEKSNSENLIYHEQDLISIDHGEPDEIPKPNQHEQHTPKNTQAYLVAPHTPPARTRNILRELQAHVLVEEVRPKKEDADPALGPSRVTPSCENTLPSFPGIQEPLYRSDIASYFAFLEKCQDPEKCIDASLSELVDSAARTMHLESEKHRPNAGILLYKVDFRQRQTAIDWLISCCSIMSLPDSLLHTVIGNFDRFCAAIPGHLPTAMMQLVFLAGICTAWKLERSELRSRHEEHATAGNAMPTPKLKPVIMQLCQHKLAFKDVSLMEQQMLQMMQFQVSAPTALEFVELLSARLKGHWALHLVEAAQAVANYLLHLASLDVRLYHGWPHIVLATSALCIALRSLAASPHLFRMILTDLSVACPAMTAQQKHIAPCGHALHSSWADFHQAGGACQAPLLHAKFRKHGTKHNGTVSLGPPRTAAANASSCRRNPSLPPRSAQSREKALSRRSKSAERRHCEDVI